MADPALAFSQSAGMRRELFRQNLFSSLPEPHTMNGHDLLSDLHSGPQKFANQPSIALDVIGQFRNRLSPSANAANVIIWSAAKWSSVAPDLRSLSSDEATRSPMTSAGRRGRRPSLLRGAILRPDWRRAREPRRLKSFGFFLDFDMGLVTFGFQRPVCGF